MRNKFFNRKTEADGILFDSAREAARYKVLKEMQKRGEITALELQPKFELLPPFVYNGKKIRGIVYRADFSYYRDGVKYIEDVKGFLTKDYKIKKKLLLSRRASAGEDVIFREIFREEENEC